jgi:hypothetical protein
VPVVGTKGEGLRLAVELTDKESGKEKEGRKRRDIKYSLIFSFLFFLKKKRIKKLDKYLCSILACVIEPTQILPP